MVASAIGSHSLDRILFLVFSQTHYEMDHYITDCKYIASIETNGGY